MKTMDEGKACVPLIDAMLDVIVIPCASTYVDTLPRKK